MTDERKPEAALSRAEFIKRFYFPHADGDVLNAAIANAEIAMSAAKQQNPGDFTWSGASVGYICDHIIRNAKLKPASNLICGQ